MSDNCSSVQCECTPVHETTWTETGQAPSIAIIEALASVEDVEPTELRPLAETVDLEALDHLLLNSDEMACGPFRFHISGWDVYISGDGRIKICDPSEPAPLSPVFEPAHSD